MRRFPRSSIVVATLNALAANVENLTLIGTAAINGTGNTLDNVLTGNSGNNSLSGGAGAETYLFGLGYGADLIVDSDATTGVKDVVKFGAGIVQSEIRFTQSGNALVATIQNSSETLTIQDWYLSANNRVEEFRFVDETVLTNVQAQALVGAVAAFNQPSSSATTTSSSEKVRCEPSASPFRGLLEAERMGRNRPVFCCACVIGAL